MRELPEALIYEKGLGFWPYKKSLARVLDGVVADAPWGARLLDIMCGPAYMLHKIKEQRPDLKLIGVDIDDRYIKHNRATYGAVGRFHKGDVCTWRRGGDAEIDVVLCLGALHHVEYERQEQAIANIASLLVPGGFAVLSDSHIREYSNEYERKLAAVELGVEYLRSTIGNGAPNDVIGWTIDIMHNDVLLDGEFKTSIQKRGAVYEKFFGSITGYRVWPDKDTGYGGYGDFVHICSLPR